jgi:hypothetical protein
MQRKQHRRQPALELASALNKRVTLDAPATCQTQAIFEAQDSQLDVYVPNASV